ncbi:hypothetical protein RND71_022321 [Anisodus tanguticus]|uniref:Plastocyanin-like domain-containing protein n=1 Tax=Anisodus tanguticus TaxID=243964 RepID=A0AAE1RZU6_9SOLA|nr:hypothetical protein RND71_022321 [Anisodus tanguticus]
MIVSRCLVCYIWCSSSTMVSHIRRWDSLITLPPFSHGIESEFASRLTPVLPFVDLSNIPNYSAFEYTFEVRNSDAERVFDEMPLAEDSPYGSNTEVLIYATNTENPHNGFVDEQSDATIFNPESHSDLLGVYPNAHLILFAIGEQLPIGLVLGTSCCRHKRTCSYPHFELEPILRILPFSSVVDAWVDTGQDFMNDSGGFEMGLEGSDNLKTAFAPYKLLGEFTKITFMHSFAGAACVQYRSLDNVLVPWCGIQRQQNSWHTHVFGGIRPVPANWNFISTSQVKDQIDSFFYFSFLSLQMTVGGFGYFLITNTNTTSFLVHFDNREFALSNELEVRDNGSIFNLVVRALSELAMVTKFTIELANIASLWMVLPYHTLDIVSLVFGYVYKLFLVFATGTQYLYLVREQVHWNNNRELGEAKNALTMVLFLIEYMGHIVNHTHDLEQDARLRVDRKVGWLFYFTHAYVSFLVPLLRLPTVSYINQRLDHSPLLRLVTARWSFFTCRDDKVVVANLSTKFCSLMKLAEALGPLPDPSSAALKSTVSSAGASYDGAAETAGDNPSVEAHPTDDSEVPAEIIPKDVLLRYFGSINIASPPASPVGIYRERVEEMVKDSHDDVVTALQHLGSLQEEKNCIQSSFNKVNAERQQNISRRNYLQEQLSKLRGELERIQAEIGAITPAIGSLDSAISAYDSSRSSLFRYILQLDNKIRELGNQQVVWELDQKVGSERLAKLENEWTAWKSHLVQAMPTITTPLPADPVAELSADTLMDL